MLKIIGIVLLFLAPVSLGAYSSFKTGAEVRQLGQILDFMYYIKKQIEFFNTPINTIYDSYCPADDEFSAFILSISANGWNYALKNTESVFVSDKTTDLLEAYGSNLGKSNKDDQIKHCDYYINLLEKEFEQLSKKAPEKKKVSLALGVYGGLMLAILFL